MKQPTNPKPGSSNSKWLYILAAVLIVWALILLVAILGLYFKEPLQQLAIGGQASPLTTAAPTLVVPTPDCGPSTLVLGATTFQIQTLAPAPDDSLSISAGTADVAYWVQGTDPNYLFVVAPTPENLSLLSAIPPDSSAKATWANCNVESYNLFAPEQSSLTAVAVPDQTVPGIEIFVQADASGNGFLLKGELAEEQINTFNTPASGGTEVQAEIGLLDTSASPEGGTVQLTVSIYNFGASPFTLSTSDVSLAPVGSAPLEMKKSDPRLPEKISAAETKTFIFTFPRPVTPTATLKIFTVEYDIEGY